MVIHYHTNLQEQLKSLQEKTSSLLANILPIEIAQELEENGSVSILFTDFVILLR
jgi:hypothetical protein